MIKWLNTIRWKNLIIIWISIIVIVAPHFDPSQIHLFFEFALWGVICTSIAAIGNLTNDMMDVKQDRANKKKNIFIGGKNRIPAIIFIVFLSILCIASISISLYARIFGMMAAGSLVFLILYNFLLKKYILIGNFVIALLTTFIFLGVDYIVQSRLSYFNLGFNNKQIELLACFAFITTFSREILKDAEDRKGDQFAGFKTLAKYFSDRWIAITIIVVNIVGCLGVYLLLNKRQVNFTGSYYLYAGWVMLISTGASLFMMSSHSSKYVIATRMIKISMLGCLLIYLYLSL